MPKPAASSKNLPQPPSLVKSIGPSFLLLGLALGSGELIMWPYLTANWGLGLIWGALLGITFQYLLNTEVMRYTLAWGESIFMGFRRLHWGIAVWYILSTFIPWSLPGFSSASADIMHSLLPGVSTQTFVFFFLIMTGILLSSGKTLYKTMERFNKTIILLGLPFLLLLVAIVTKYTDWITLFAGYAGQGNGWRFLPKGVEIAAFLGAFAYSGAGGNLNLAQSYYVKEKGFGMGAYAQKISSLFSGKSQAVNLEGALFSDTSANRSAWKKWWRMIVTEHGLVFWGLGILTISCTALLSYVLVYGKPVQAGLSFIFTEAEMIGAAISPVFRVFFLVIVAGMLFSTQTGVLESSSRIISENVLLLFYKKGRRYNTSIAFYVALWSQLGLAAFLYVNGYKDARGVLTMAAVMNAAAMMVSFPLVWILNRQRLPKYCRSSFLRNIAYAIAFAFFVFFVGMTIKGLF